MKRSASSPRLDCSDSQPLPDRFVATLDRFVAAHDIRIVHFESGLNPRILSPNWHALLPAEDTLPRPLRNAVDPLDAQIRSLHEAAALAA